MTFKDIFKKSFLEKFNHENINTSSIVMYLGMAIILGLFIYLVYRFSSKSSFHLNSIRWQTEQITLEEQRTFYRNKLDGQIKWINNNIN